nr:unnamed protein product [Callosobruchus chinensis]
MPKTEKSQQGLTIRVEVQKNSRLIGQCHSCQKYGHAQSYCTASPKCLKCAQDHMTHLCPQTGQEVRKCANCGGDHPANSFCGGQYGGRHPIEDHISACQVWCQAAGGGLGGPLGLLGSSCRGWGLQLHASSMAFQAEFY